MEATRRATDWICMDSNRPEPFAPTGRRACQNPGRWNLDAARPPPIKYLQARPERVMSGPFKTRRPTAVRRKRSP
jgi:hypothetical protein